MHVGMEGDNSKGRENPGNREYGTMMLLCELQLENLKISRVLVVYKNIQFGKARTTLYPIKSFRLRKENDMPV